MLANLETLVILNNQAFLEALIDQFLYAFAL